MPNTTGTNAMTIMMPNLDEAGWGTSTTFIADRLFSHFMVADYSQTQIYLGKVSSFSWVIHESQGDMTKSVVLLRDTLQNYFGRYFSKVTVDVSDITDVNTPSQVALSVYLNFTDSEGKVISLGKTIEMIDGTVNKIVNLNNYGTEPTTT